MVSGDGEWYQDELLREREVYIYTNAAFQGSDTWTAPYSDATLFLRLWPRIVTLGDVWYTMRRWPPGAQMHRGHLDST